MVFVEEPQREDMGSILADIVAHMGQDVSFARFSILPFGLLSVSLGNLCGLCQIIRP